MRGVFDQLAGEDCPDDRYLEISAVLYAAISKVLRGSADPSYLAVSDHPVFLGLMDTLYEWSHGFSKHASLTTLDLLDGFLVSTNACYQMARFHLGGRRAYDVSPGLAEQLRATSLRGVGADDLHLPYPSIYIIVPTRANLRVWNNDSGLHQCVGIYVSEEPSLAIRNLENLESADAEPRCRGWRIMLVGTGKGDLVWDDAILYFQVALIPGKPIDECLDLEQEFMQAAQKANKVPGGFGEWIEWRAAFDWLMNTVLYATYVEPGENWEANEEARNLWSRIEKLPKGAKRDRLKERYRTLSKKPRILLGRSIAVRRGRPEGVVQSGPARKVLDLRVQVAGHWKRVAHGPGLVDRRWQWIEPYWRGDGVELPSRRHNLS